MNRNSTFWIVISDVLLYVITFMLTLKLRTTSNLFIYFSPIDYQWNNVYLSFGFVLLPVYFLSFYIFGLYDDIGNNLVRRIFALSLLFSVLFSFAVAFMFVIDVDLIPRSILITFFLLNYFLSIVFHGFLNLIFFSKHKIKNLLVINDNSDYFQTFLPKLEAHINYRFKVRGVLTGSLTNSAKKIKGIPVKGDWRSINKVVEQYPDTHIILVIVNDIALKEKVVARLNFILLSRLKIRVFIAPSLYETVICYPKYLTLQDFPLLEINIRQTGRWLIRCSNVLLAIFLFGLVSPLFILVYLALKLDINEKPFFIQKRVGFNEKEFSIYKFRTMKNSFTSIKKISVGLSDVKSKKNNPHSRSNLDKDRLTWFGKYLRTWRIDELPQLINIIKGDMNFIGPRPLITEEVRAFKKSIEGFSERFTVLPGITGLAQVHGNYFTDAREKLKYDLWYIYHRSPLLDFQVALQTIKTIILKRGH